jgi:predicted enzyme related to lactoylglutathione lyase
MALLPFGIAQGRVLVIAPNLEIRRGISTAFDIAGRDDGQSVEVSKIVKGSFANKQSPASTKSIAPTVSTLNFGIKLPTRELNKAVCFYKEILGLEIKRKTSDIVTFEQGLVLVPGNYPESQYGGSEIHAIVYIKVADIEGRFSKVKDGRIKIVTPLSVWGNSKRSYFRCCDLDGNIIEVFSTGNGLPKDD